MAPIKHVKLGLIAAALVASTAAHAQQSQGNTSGPAAGTVVDPNAAVQKQYLQEEQRQGRSIEAPVTPGATGGMPGVEAKPGTEGGTVAPEKIPVR